MHTHFLGAHTHTHTQLLPSRHCYLSLSLSDGLWDRILTHTYTHARASRRARTDMGATSISAHPRAHVQSDKDIRVQERSVLSLLPC